MANSSSFFDKIEKTSSSSFALEVTGLSAEDLRIDHHSLKKNAFVIVKADSFNHRATKVDALGGSNPSWDEKIVINLPTNANFLTLEVLRRSSTSGDRLIGTSRVLVSDFVGGYTPDNYLHCLSYRLKDPYGKKNGIINLSVRVLNMPDGYVCSSSQQKLEISGYKSSSSLMISWFNDTFLASARRYQGLKFESQLHQQQKKRVHRRSTSWEW